MKRSFVTIMLLSGLLLLLSGCEEPFGVSGKQVRFSATSRSDFATKTAYSGEFATVDGKKYERINWVENDEICIYSKNKRVKTDVGNPYATYFLTGIRTEGVKSIGKLKNTREGSNENGLTWGNVESETFYGFYPAASAVENAEGYPCLFPISFPDAQTATPNMDYAYMGAKSEDVQNNEDVNLQFYPAFSAFEVHLSSAIGAIQLVSASLSTTNTVVSNALAGTGFYYDVDPATGDIPLYSPSDATPKYSISIPLSDITINEDTETVFTFFTLPHDVKNLVLTVVYLQNGTSVTRSLALNNGVTAENPTGTPMTFAAGKKAILRGVALQDALKFTLELGLEVMEWTVGGNSTIEFSNTVTSTRFDFTSEEYGGNVDITNPAGSWDFIFNNINTSIMYITFTIQTPTGATWSVQKDDPNDYFDLVALNDGVASAPTGTVNNEKITLCIRPKPANIPSSRTLDYSMLLHTYVEVGDKAYNIDSETQIYDQYLDLAHFIIPANN